MVGEEIISWNLSFMLYCDGWKILTTFCKACKSTFKQDKIVDGAFPAKNQKEEEKDQSQKEKMQVQPKKMKNSAYTARAKIEEEQFF